MPPCLGVAYSASRRSWYPLLESSMRRRIASIVALLATATLLASCGDNGRNGTLPTGPVRPGAAADIVPGTCTTLSNLVSLVNTVFGAGSPNANSALGKLSNLDKQLQSGNLA